MNMALKKILSEFWAARATRERQFLLAGGGALALALLYAIFVAPAVGRIGELQRQLPVTRARAARLEALIAEAKSLRALPPTATLAAGDVRASLEKSLDGAGLKAARMDSLPSGDLRITFVDVPYGNWTSWLATSERTMGVHTVAARIKANTGGAQAGPSGSAGHADIELTLHLLRAG